MKLLLCSDFSGVGYKYLNKFFDNTKGLNCLFVGYAQDDPYELMSGTAMKFKEMGINVFSLVEGYQFDRDIDIVFVRGGNTTRLIHYLRKFNQFEKVKELVEKQGVVYIGSSAGSVLVGTDTEYCLRSEPYEEDVKSEFGEDSLKGFGWINKKVIVHCSKYRLCWGFEMENEKDLFRTPDNECYPTYLEDKKVYKRSDYIKIANNQAYIINNNQDKLITYNWSNLPIKIINKNA